MREAQRDVDLFEASAFKDNVIGVVVELSSQSRNKIVEVGGFNVFSDVAFEVRRV